MKRYHSAVSLTLAVLAVLALARPVVAQVQVPFKGSLAGADVAIPIPNTTFVSVTVKATGDATLLGKFTFTELTTVNSATRMGSGTFLFVAANGDTVSGTIIGQAKFTPPNVLSIVESGIITGGTGRFAGATGSFTVSRVKNTVTGATTATFMGSISTPGF